MKKSDVVIGKTYTAKIAGQVTVVKITGESRYGGWDGINTRTNRGVRIKSAQKLRREYIPPRDCGDMKFTYDYYDNVDPDKEMIVLFGDRKWIAILYGDRAVEFYDDMCRLETEIFDQIDPTEYDEIGDAWVFDQRVQKTIRQKYL
jgi:hypothetical protein